MADEKEVDQREVDKLTEAMKKLFLDGYKLGFRDGKKYSYKEKININNNYQKAKKWIDENFPNCF